MMLLLVNLLRMTWRTILLTVLLVQLSLLCVFNCQFFMFCNFLISGIILFSSNICIYRMFCIVLALPSWRINTHTHPFNGPFSGTTEVNRYQKGKINLDFFLKQETVSGSGISWDICKSAPRSRQITTPAPHRSVFLQTGCPSCRPTNSVEALKAACGEWTSSLMTTVVVCRWRYDRHVVDAAAESAAHIWRHLWAPALLRRSAGGAGRPVQPQHARHHSAQQRRTRPRRRRSTHCAYIYASTASPHPHNNNNGTVAVR